jgi:hypothetical protein
MNDTLLTNLEFIQDLCRFSENLVSEAAIKKKYRLADDVWEALGSEETLIERIEAEKIRRERLGLTARERAQRAFSSTPTVLDGILHGGDGVSPRHKIEAAREIRAIAANGPNSTPTTEQFVILIDLGGDEKLTVSGHKPYKPKPNDGKVIDAEMLPMLAAKKNNNDDGSRGGAW